MRLNIPDVIIGGGWVRLPKPPEVVVTAKKLLIAVAAVAFLVQVLAGCASKSEIEKVREEIAASKGEIERLKSAIASQVQDIKLLQGTVETLRNDVRELREAQKAAPEKVQNKSSGAKPKSKKRRK